jgi:hypothetical protein
LGGGYGRGEGGIVLIDNIEQPYNDLDFTLVVKNKQTVPFDKLSHISHTYEAEIHIDVDFSRPLTIGDIQNWPSWLMWYDLLNGHIVVCGDPEVIRTNAPPNLRCPLPAIEAARLLLNRGAGLLWAMRVVRGREKPIDPDFVRRNYYKCHLSLGDALLIAWGRHKTSYTGRDERLHTLMMDEDNIRSLQLDRPYQLALQFKFRPDHDTDISINLSDLQKLAHLWGLVYLLVEQRRTGLSWLSMTDYCDWDDFREPEQHGVRNWPRNIVHNKRMGLWSLTYPRERLYRTLPGLLGLVDGDTAEWDTESLAFLDVWNRFN